MTHFVFVFFCGEKCEGTTKRLNGEKKYANGSDVCEVTSTHLLRTHDQILLTKVARSKQPLRLSDPKYNIHSLELKYIPSKIFQILNEYTAALVLANTKKRKKVKQKKNKKKMLAH